jgi:hypothetical protein
MRTLKDVLVVWAMVLGFFVVVGLAWWYDEALTRQAFAVVGFVAMAAVGTCLGAAVTGAWRRG